MYKEIIIIFETSSNLPFPLRLRKVYKRDKLWRVWPRIMLCWG